MAILQKLGFGIIFLALQIFKQPRQRHTACRNLVTASWQHAHFRAVGYSSKAGCADRRTCGAAVPITLEATGCMYNPVGPLASTDSTTLHTLFAQVNFCASLSVTTLLKC